MSGGVNSIARTKKPIIKYGRIFLIVFLLVMPVLIIKKVATGISKASPKAKNSFSTKSRYLLMSVITWIESGAAAMKKFKMMGLTTKNAKATPA